MADWLGLGFSWYAVYMIIGRENVHRAPGGVRQVLPGIAGEALGRTLPRQSTGKAIRARLFLMTGPPGWFALALATLVVATLLSATQPRVTRAARLRSARARLEELRGELEQLEDLRGELVQLGWLLEELEALEESALEQRAGDLRHLEGELQGLARRLEVVARAAAAPQ